MKIWYYYKNSDHRLFKYGLTHCLDKNKVNRSLYYLVANNRTHTKTLGLILIKGDK